MSQSPESYLVLVRHSLTEMEADVPSAQWALSAEGRRRCHALARELVPYHLDRLFASSEPKAQETASLISQELDLPILLAGGLHEQERASVPFSTPEQFRAGIESLFNQPNELVFGDETANEATQRFSRAINWILGDNPAQNLAIVTHGTVMTLWLARTCGVSPFQFWRELGLPAYVALSRPDLEILKVVNNILLGDKG